MEINLEKIELVKDRTGVSYREAKEALEFANGNVVDAIIYIEENINHDFEGEEKDNASKVIDVIKNTIKKGNVTKIKVYRNDEIILSIPVTVGAIATVAFPWGMLAAAVATAASKCSVKLELEDGNVVDVSEKLGEAYGTIKSKSEVVYDELKDKTEDYYQFAREKGANLYEQAKDKGAALYEQARSFGSDIYEDALEKGGDFYEQAREKVADYLDRQKEDRIYDISDIDLEEDEEEDY